MDQLVDQASDLRSFIGQEGAQAAAYPTESVSGSHHLSPPLPPPDSHHSMRLSSAGVGDNSALLPMYQQHQQQHPASSFAGSPAASDHGNGKRKADDEEGSGTKQQRSKRNRYISIACNECKRRKIKCNGQTPCQRCGNLNLQCLYAPNCCPNNFKDSDEFRQMTDQVSRLQEQVDRLINNMNDLRQETLRLAPIQDRILPLPTNGHTPSPSTSSFRSLARAPLPPPPRVPNLFNGPTSMNFTVDMAKNTLHNMGYPNLGEGHDDSTGAPGETPGASPMLRPLFRPPSPPLQKPAPDPLWEFDKNEMIRLCQVYEEEVGIMYPVAKMDSVLEYATFLAAWMQSAKRNGLVPTHGTPEGISDMKTCMLKIVLCCALVVEEHGNSVRANQLYESMRPIIDRKLMSERANVEDMPFMALVGGYRFLANEEVLAWRAIGQVSRLCMELGLHRREGLAAIPDEASRRHALNTFWTAYVLDRRWSFGTGLPYVCHDDMIDPKLPMPDYHPYLCAMVNFSKLGAKIWRLVDYFEPAVIRDLRPEDFEQLDREILDWYETVPEEIKVTSLNGEIPMPSGPAYDNKRLQIWTRLRLNQMRIWLHTPVLHSASSIAGNMHLAQLVVDLSKDTIRYLARLNNTTNLYRRIQVFYHQFLTSAIAVLFLASTHAPLQFSAQCRNEFYMALELIKDMSARSWVSQRLWRTVRSLKAYAPRLGLQEHGEQRHPAEAATSPHQHSPAGMLPSFIRTPGHASRHYSSGPPASGSAGSTPTSQHTSSGDDRNNGVRLQTEMSKLFDGYMNSAPGPGAGMGNTGSPGEDGVYQHFKELF